MTFENLMTGHWLLYLTVALVEVGGVHLATWKVLKDDNGVRYKDYIT